MSAENKYFSAQVNGLSMFPTLRPGDNVLVKLSLISEIEEFDIIVYAGRSERIVHRVIKILPGPSGTILRIRGDFTREAEEVDADKVLGKVIGIYRRNGLKLLSFETARAYLLFINTIIFLKTALKRLFPWLRLPLMKNNPATI